jgi:hypothetical protein
MASQKSSIAAGTATAERKAPAGYEQDILAWSDQQAALLRAGRFDLLDILHIADEIEDVGKSEKRELRSRTAVLLAHLLKWQAQPDYRGKSWERTIRAQRKAIRLHLDEVPSLKAILRDRRWLSGVWADAVSQAAQETGLEAFPEECPWDLAGEVLAEGWLPQL